MRDRIPVTLPSAVVTALIAAGAGVVSVLWHPATSALPEAAIAHAEEAESTSDGAATDDGLAVEVQSTRASVVDERIVLESRLVNVGTAPAEIDGGGVYDLVVERAASPCATRLGGVSFLALTEVAVRAPITLRPGDSLSHALDLAPSAPFDEPGRYVVSGHWHAGAASAVVRPFDVVIDGCRGVACRGTTTADGV